MRKLVFLCIFKFLSHGIQKKPKTPPKYFYEVCTTALTKLDICRRRKFFRMIAFTYIDFFLNLKQNVSKHNQTMCRNPIYYEMELTYKYWDSF